MATDVSLQIHAPGAPQSPPKSSPAPRLDPSSDRVPGMSRQATLPAENGVTGSPTASSPVSDGQKHRKGALGLPSAPAMLRNAVSPNAEERPLSQQSMDPLSLHIHERLGTAPERGKSRSGPDTNGGLVPTTTGSDIAEGKPNPEWMGTESLQQGKDKKNRASFLSRFKPNKRKEETEDLRPSEFEAGDDDRPEGADAQLFYTPCDNMGFNPRYPQPPPYIKVRARLKTRREFNRVFLAQCLEEGGLQRRTSSADLAAKLGRKRSNTESEAVWALEVSKDGRYLASTGQNPIINVWAIIASHEDRQQLERDEEARDGVTVNHLSAPVFCTEPHRVYEGHTGPVLDLSWSKNNFLLSSSMDKTVRLWHVSRPECLCAFKHNDYVTSIAFHPKDDRFFLAGSLDSKLRLWSIPDKTVAFWSQATDMITAVAFTPDGKQAIAGSLTGNCLFFETEGLKYVTQIQVRSTHGRNAKGSKITGIQTIHMPPESTNPSDVKVLISSNDSRVRLYNIRDKSLEMKFKGNVNTSSQIHARFSDDARYVICGSEDNKVFVWSTSTADSEKKDKWPFEVFEAHSAATTVALLAPVRSRQILSLSEDPIYDMCNPPPVTLISRAEAAESSRGGSRPPPAEDQHSEDFSKSPTDTSSIQATPTEQQPAGFKRAEESPAYIARTIHREGNIILTADASGAIKIFRQDCAWEKRRAADPLADSSSLRRVSTGLIRKASSAASTHSRSTGLHRTPSTTSTQHRNSERILHWRNSIATQNTHERSVNGASAASSPALSAVPHRASLAGLNALRGQTRSISPRKSVQLPLRSRTVVSNGNHDSTPSLTSSPTLARTPSDWSTAALPATAPAAPGATSPKPNHDQLRHGATFPISATGPTTEATLPASGRTAHGPSRQSAPILNVPQGRASHSATAPAPLFRQDSSLYSRQYAWSDEIADQLAAPHHDYAHTEPLPSPANPASRNSRSQSPAKGAYTSQGNAGTHASSTQRSEHGDSHLLRPDDAATAAGAGGSRSRASSVSGRGRTGGLIDMGRRLSRRLSGFSDMSSADSSREASKAPAPSRGVGVGGGGKRPDAGDEEDEEEEGEDEFKDAVEGLE